MELIFLLATGAIKCGAGLTHSRISSCRSAKSLGAGEQGPASGHGLGRTEWRLGAADVSAVRGCKVLPARTPEWGAVPGLAGALFQLLAGESRYCHAYGGLWWRMVSAGCPEHRPLGNAKLKAFPRVSRGFACRSPWLLSAESAVPFPCAPVGAQEERPTWSLVQLQVA